MSADLHSRIASELSRRLEVAKAARAEMERMGWTAQGFADGLWKRDVYGAEAVWNHVELHDPADSVRRYSSALGLLAELASWAHHVNQNSFYTCPLALDDDGETLCSDDTAVGCTCGLDDRRTAVLLLVAASLGLDTEGSTTDG